MGKNKKWKRKAKRIKGECTVRLHCEECLYNINDECYGVIANVDHTPSVVGIRTIERICKYGK